MLFFIDIFQQKSFLQEAVKKLQCLHFFGSANEDRVKLKKGEKSVQTFTPTGEVSWHGQEPGCSVDRVHFALLLSALRATLRAKFCYAKFSNEIVPWYWCGDTDTDTDSDTNPKMFVSPTHWKVK